MKDYDDECSEFRLDTPEEHNFGFDVVHGCAEDFLVLRTMQGGTDGFFLD
jgi:hypothetical protein